MKTGIYFLIQSLFFSILLIIIYFNKKRLNTTENKIYSCLIVTSVVEIVIELLLDVIMPVYTSNILLSSFLAKTYCVVILIWLSLLITYVSVVTLEEKKKNDNKKTIKNIFITITIVSALLVYISPINFYYENSIYYTYGPSVNVDYAVSFIYILIGVLCLIWNKGNLKNKKYIPIFTFLLIGGIAGVIQMIYPSLLLSTGVHTFITFLMYFTIENPDLKMVEALNKNKKITEQNFEEKTSFLFKISQDLKKPLLDITEISSDIIENSKNQIKEQAKMINNSSKQLYTYVNNALDISNMDIKNIKIINNTYNTKNLFEEIKLRVNNELKEKNKNIEFICEISKNIPKTLVGDNTKLKQIILSVIFDSIKHTEKGYIELNVNTIVRYDVCRLIIEISDTGEGMELEKINKILSSTGDLTEDELKRIDTLDISLFTSQKIIKTVNGNFMIRSELNKGTTFVIVVDQKIKEEIKNTKLEKYANEILSNKKVLIISSDNNIVNAIRKKLEDVDVVNSLYGKDAIQKLKNKEKFNLVLIDDKLKNESGIEVLKKLNQTKNFKTPAIILINKNTEFIKEHYIEDGFENYIIKENLKELDKIDKYI